MNMLEVFAAVFAVLILLKLVLYLFYPKKVLETGVVFAKQKTALFALLALLALASGYYVFKELTLVQVVAAMFFLSMLIGLSYLPFVDEFLELRRKILRSKNASQKLWLSFAIWIALALAALYVVFLKP